MKIRSDNYINIQGFMRTELKLTGNDLLVYAIIYGFSQDGESRFTLSLQYLADWCGATKQGIQKNLKNLLERGLIVKDANIINGVKYVSYYTTQLHTIQLSCINNISNNHLDNIISNKQQELFTDNNIEVRNKEVKATGEVEQFIEDYNSICVSLPKCRLLTDKRKKAVLKLLKKYPYEDVLTVFKKLEASDFCTNRKGTGWKASFDFILSEDKFINVLEGKYDNAKGRGVETISQGEKRVVSAEEKERLFKNGKKF